MQQPDVALVTTTAYLPTPGPGNWYNQQIHEEDRLLTEALKAHGLTAARVDWNDPEFSWFNVRCAVIRTTWDYNYRFAEFAQWVEQVAAQTTLINPPDLMRWNMDKHYLADLASRGVSVVETVFTEQGETQNLQQLAQQRAWDGIVIKPAISGGARHTYRAQGPEEIAALQSTFDTCVAQEAMLVQPFEKEILQTGEVSLMLMGGRYTHGVRKTAKAGDFRVQDDHGGTVRAYEPEPDVIHAAERAVAACHVVPVYARVDLVLPPEGPRLMELELVEPELWMRFHPSSAGVLAGSIADYLASATAASR